MRTYKLKQCKRVHGIYFAPSGQRLLAVGGELAAWVYCALWLDLATGESIGRIQKPADCYAVSPDMSRYILGNANRWNSAALSSVQWISLPEATEWRGFQSDAGVPPPTFSHVAGLAIDATGTRLAIRHAQHLGIRSSPNQTTHVITVVERDTGEAVTHFDADDRTGVMAFNVDGTRLTVAGDTTVTVYDLTTGKTAFVFTPPSTVTRCVQFLCDNRLIVANERYVSVLPPEGGEPQFTLAGHPKQVNAVAVTPDGRRILTASHDGMIRTWDANTGEPGPAFDWGIGAITAIAFAPDGLTCAAAALKGKVVVWDVDY